MIETQHLDVSRETIEVLRNFEQDLIDWNQKINLIAKSTLNDTWHRHILDSAQLFGFMAATDTNWTDIGSGGGLPGLVVSIMAKQERPGMKFNLIESDQRKAAFLRTTTAKYGLRNEIHAKRAEHVTDLNSDIVSARAFAPLDRLLAYALPHVSKVGRIVLLKGKSAEEEIEIARKNWHFDVVTRPSLTDTESLVLEITNVVSKT